MNKKDRFVVTVRWEWAEVPAVAVAILRDGRCCLEVARRLALVHREGGATLPLVCGAESAAGGCAVHATDGHKGITWAALPHGNVPGAASKPTLAGVVIAEQEGRLSEEGAHCHRRN